jgi:hypothetical protein
MGCRTIKVSAFKEPVYYVLASTPTLNFQKNLRGILYYLKCFLPLQKLLMGRDCCVLETRLRLSQAVTLGHKLIPTSETQRPCPKKRDVRT